MVISYINIWLATHLWPLISSMFFQPEQWTGQILEFSWHSLCQIQVPLFDLGMQFLGILSNVPLKYVLSGTYIPQFSEPHIWHLGLQFLHYFLFPLFVMSSGGWKSISIPMTISTKDCHSSNHEWLSSLE